MRHYLLLLFILFGCAPQPPIQPDLRPVTPAALEGADAAVLCQSAQNAADPLEKIEALEALNAAGASCAGFSISQALYVAYVHHAEQLSADGATNDARLAYETALNYTEIDSRARDALAAMAGEAAQSTDTCTEEQIAAAHEAMAAPAPDGGAFIALANGSLTINARPFTVRGVTYEARDYPGRRLLAQSTLEAVAPEMDLIAGARFNVIRVYLYHDVLFQCPDSGAVPIPAAFNRLDGLLRTAAERNIRVIMVLHHHMDVAGYTRSSDVSVQASYLVQRYADYSDILAWDVRDGGDIDYTERGVEREAVLAWLAGTVQLVRQHAPNHLVTAGWHSDAAATAPFVDFVSFQHYGSVDDLRQQIAVLRSQTAKPLLLAGVGYPTGKGDEIGQRDQLYNALLAADNNDLLGWVVFTAFDHPSSVCETCGRFGLWNTSYFPKLALEAPQTIIDGG